MVKLRSGSTNRLVQLAGKLVPLRFGAWGPLQIRHERFCWGRSHCTRLLYLSDLHLGHWWTRTVPEQLLDAVKQTHPDMILLGGDLVDRKRALPSLHACIQTLTQHAPVVAVPGNHDVYVGLSDVRRTVQAAGARWLPDASVTEPIPIDANITSATEPHVLCAHYPNIFPKAVQAGYRLVLAGHLHGGQCVLATIGDRLYPGVWFDRWHVLRATLDNSTLVVSRGVADTLPIRFNCSREAVVCDIS